MTQGGPGGVAGGGGASSYAASGGPNKYISGPGGDGFVIFYWTEGY